MLLSQRGPNTPPHSREPLHVHKGELNPRKSAAHTAGGCSGPVPLTGRPGGRHHSQQRLAREGVETTGRDGS